MIEPNKILVIIPAFNEERSVRAVVEQVRRVGFDVIVIDDGSSDDTYVQSKIAGARTIRLPFNVGVGAALQCGFRFAQSHNYFAVVQCDADGQHLPSEIPRLVEALDTSSAAMVVGSRFRAERDGARRRLPRRIAMKILARIASGVSGRELTDTTSGFRAIREPLLSIFADDFPQSYLGDTFEAIVFAGRHGHEVLEIPVVMDDRKFGSSSANTIQSIVWIAKSLANVFLNLQQGPRRM